MDERTRDILESVGGRVSTPCFVYLVDDVRDRIRALDQAFGGHFTVSYAVKANPNLGLLRFLRAQCPAVDVSSIGELERIIHAGFDANQASFSGPGKRPDELQRAVELGCGEVVCESPEEVVALNSYARDADRNMPCLIRINPARVPRKFGVNMAGKPSQFGIDEEQVDHVLSQKDEWSHLDLRGFHIYSGTNCLDEEAIADNFSIFIELFSRLATRHSLEPERLIFGSGFGIPYLPGEGELSLEKLAGLINPQIEELRRNPRLGRAKLVLELGRWIVGPAGYLLTRVTACKRSRGVEIRICDAGFNNLLPAFGMMGTVIRRNWRIWHLGPKASPAIPLEKLLLVGPLCTTIDVLATDIELPPTEVGDLLAVGAAGAYGLTASPTRFISHPEPLEFLVRTRGGTHTIEDVTESHLNWPADQHALTQRS